MQVYRLTEVQVHFPGIESNRQSVIALIFYKYEQIERLRINQSFKTLLQFKE